MIRYHKFGPPPDPAQDYVPAKLRAARQKIGLTQNQLAERLGVSTGTVQAWNSDEADLIGELPIPCVGFYQRETTEKASIVPDR